MLNKSKITKIKRKFFINDSRKNLFAISLLLIITIGLILITTTIFLENSNGFVKNWNTNIRFVLQMFFTGASLGIGSYLIQRMTNNKLADTSVMGLGNFNLIPIAALAISTDFSGSNHLTGKLTATQYSYIMPIIVVIASITMTLIFNFMSKDKTKFNFKKLLISGIILNLVSVAIAFSLSAAGDTLSSQRIEQKVIGTIDGNTSEFNFYFSMSVIIFAFLWLLINSYKIQLVIQNQEIARQTGVANISIMIQTMICIGLLVGGSYAMSGDFVFVGLVAGNIAFKISKTKVSYGIATSGLIGGSMVMATYFIFSNLINVPTGIIAPLIPLIISPYFVYLLIRWK